MNNNQLYPFERNRYYAGKMLTSADFQAEQTYFNNKRRFINSLMFGAGIICGCGVFSLDDLSLLIESGAAIDDLGREIVLESSVVKKLSAIDGFENLQSEHASLCLRYKEDKVHTVYAMNHKEAEDEYQFNRISEGYQLFLMDTENIAGRLELETEFLTRCNLFINDDYAIEVSMPAITCKGRNVCLMVSVIKRSEEKKKISYHSILQTPAFTTAEGTHEIHVDLENIQLAMGERITKSYWVRAQDFPIEATNILVLSGSDIVNIDGVAVAYTESFSLKVKVEDVSPRELVTREIGRMSLEMKDAGGACDYIRLADLKLVKTDNAYIIEEVYSTIAKNYITAPAQENARDAYLDYFIKDVDIEQNATPQLSGQDAEIHNWDQPKAPEIATGTLEISLGEVARKGDIRYSGEIMHGLGKGNVYVQIGYESIADDPALGEKARSTIYGNPDLFEPAKNHKVNVETAVKVLNDKGSFVVAAQLLENIDFLVLTYRWVAIKFPSGNDLGLIEDYKGKSISAETPTVVLGTKESHYFNVKYHNMDSCSVAYELTEAGSGEITAEGIYTAPAKEGVYEIRIYCTDMPVICTYAYAIVKKKGFEDENGLETEK